MFTKSPAARRTHGFTLIEVVIAMALVALLTAIALPSFQEAFRKSRRSDAMSALSRLMQAQERYRANNSSYASDLSSLIAGDSLSVSANGHYTLSIVTDSASASGYVAQATARSTSPQIADTLCRVLQVTVAGGDTTYASAASSGATNTTDPCWVK